MKKFTVIHFICATVHFVEQDSSILCMAELCAKQTDN